MKNTRTIEAQPTIDQLEAIAIIARIKKHNNLFYNIAKTALHILAVYISYYGMIEPFRGLFTEFQIKAYTVAITVVCYIFLAVLEKIYSTQLRLLVETIRARQCASSVTPFLGVFISGGIGTILLINGASQTPYYKRTNKVASHNLKPVDSLRKAYTAKLILLEQSKKYQLKKAEDQHMPGIRIADKNLLNAFRWKVDSLTAQKIRITKAYSSDKYIIAKAYNNQYKKDSIQYAPLLAAWKASNHAAISKVSAKDAKTGFEMTLFGIAINILIIFLTTISTPLKGNEFVNIFTPVNNVVNNTANTVNILYQSISQKVTIDSILADKKSNPDLKKRAVKLFNNTDRRLIGNALIPIIQSGSKVPLEIKRMVMDIGYSKEYAYTFHNTLRDLMVDQGLVELETKKETTIQ